VIVIHGVAYADPTDAKAQVERLYPRPAGVTAGDHVFPDLELREDSFVFFVTERAQRKSVWIWQCGEWKLVTEDAERTLFMDGGVVWGIPGPSGDRSFLYDAASDRTFSLPGTDTAVRAYAREVPGLEGLAIGLFDLNHRQRYVLHWTPGQGVRPLPTDTHLFSLLYVDETGIEIREEPNYDIVRQEPTGAIRVLWTQP
jgi:hypothetical protein